jgi:hypothetical protein
VSAVICPSLLIGVTSVLFVPKDCIHNSFFHHISYITSIPIDLMLPKLLNYLAFQSFDFELPDKVIPETFMCTKFDIYVFINSFY